MVFRNSDHESLCKLLVSARLAAGLTQRDLASKLERPPSMIASIETGDRRLDVLEFIQLANAIGADPKKLFSQLIRSIDG